MNDQGQRKIAGRKGTVMTPSEVHVEFATDKDVAEAVGSALASAGVTLDQLRRQARESRFSSESARSAWFVISPFVAHA
jgi:hypothetical protein